jgi:biotin carboxyl carrier protein
MRHLITISMIALGLIYSCKSNKENSAATQPEGRVPVTITHPDTSQLVDAIELNATSIFHLKTSVKAFAGGYLQEVNAQLGEKINKGKKLFVIRTKESENLGNTLSSADPSLNFSGLISISAPGSGYITQLNYQAGDYVQDGETLALISNTGSLVFLLDLPYELKPFLPLNKTVELTLPDGQKLKGTLSNPMPVVDPVSQTQSFVIKVSSVNAIPENLVAKVAFIKNSKSATLSLPKEAILSNETQSEFWIMKMTDSITAVKIVVTKGIETADRVEILSPELNPADNILLTGNFGLPDTSKVTILKRQE